MSSPHESAVDPVFQAVGVELMRMARRSSRVYPGSVVDLSAFKILWLLKEAGSMSMKDLASELMLDQSTVSRQIKASIERGLIERHDDESTSTRMVRATAEGSKVYEQEAALRAAVIWEALEAMGVERAGEFVVELTVFNDALDEAYARAKTAGA